MQVHLKYAPTVENAPRFASDIVAAAREISEVRLDFEVESLDQVDRLLEGMRQDGCTSEQLAATLFGFGCYVGEVFVRHAAGRWRNAAETSMADLAAFPLVIELDNDRICNPIGKVFKRVDHGEEDNLPYFYHVMTTARE